MHSTCDYNSSSYSDFFWSRAEVGYDGHFTVVACNRLAHNSLTYPIFALRLTKLLKELSAIRVSIGVAMCQVHLVIIVVELNLEGQSVVEATSLFLQRVLEVADILAVSVPTYALSIV
jgi:hypothetical protein